MLQCRESTSAASRLGKFQHFKTFVAAEPKPNVTSPHLFNLISQSPPGKNILLGFFFSKLLLSMGKTGIPPPQLSIQKECYPVDDHLS